MKPKRSKYDTNPLDGEVADRATESFESTSSGPPTEKVTGGPTRDIGRTANEAPRALPESEAPTRRIDDSYPSVFAYQQPRQATYQPPPLSPNVYQPPRVPPPNVYQPPPAPVGHRAPSSGHVAGLNIPEKWATILPYFPFGFLGIIAAVIELLLVPRTETRTRFHAAQGMALQAVFLIIATALGMISNLTDSRIGSGLFWIASTVFLFVSIARVWNGKPHHIAPLDEATKWLDEKIKPRK